MLSKSLNIVGLIESLKVLEKNTIKRKIRRVVANTFLKKVDGIKWHKKVDVDLHLNNKYISFEDRQNCSNKYITVGSSSLLHIEICELCEVFVIKKDLRFSPRGTSIVRQTKNKEEQT